MNTPLFSIILLHYNQPKYVKQALNSILIQDYDNIELIFADDSSSEIDLLDLKEYVDNNKNANIKNVVWQINEKNLGTVKSLNSAIKKCKGEYLLFFAADDALCNEKVISNFKKSFDAAPEDVYMISSQCHMMDVNMEKDMGLFVNPGFASTFNKYNSEEQYKIFTQSCFLAIGSTAMKMQMFEKYGMFNESYKFVEDWSYYLHLTRNGGRIQYSDFDGLFHRDGGVSHYNSTNYIPDHVKAYRYDIVCISQNEILPYIGSYSYKEKFTLISNYERYKKDYFNCNGDKPVYSKSKLIKLFPAFYGKKFISNTLLRFENKKRLVAGDLLKIILLWASLLVILNLYETHYDNFIYSALIANFIRILVQFVCPLLFVWFAISFVIMILSTTMNKLRSLIKKL